MTEHDLRAKGFVETKSGFVRVKPTVETDGKGSPCHLPSRRSDFDSSERSLHDKIESELKRRRWYYVHSRTDRPTTTALGVTDFIIAVPINGRTIWMEVKRKGGKLTKEQNVTRHLLTASLHIHRVVYSLKEAIEVFDWQEL